MKFKMMCCCLALVFSIFSCTETEDISPQMEALDFSKIDFSTAFSNIDFNQQNDITVELKPNATTKDIVAIVVEKYKEFAVGLMNRSKVAPINMTYNVKIDTKAVLFTDFEVQAISPDAKSNGMGMAVNDAWNCPQGATLLGTCYSPECVGEMIQEHMGGFSSGDTATITVHHGGVFGAKVCLDL